MPFGKAFVYQAPKRKKTEVFWSGITGLTLTADTDYNLVALLKALPAPAFGTLAPFFNTVSNKLNAYNDNASLMFKLNLAGLWSAATENRSMQLDFLGTNGNRLVASRDAAVRLMWSPWPPFSASIAMAASSPMAPARSSAATTAVIPHQQSC